jgi:uncharacterized ferritin-like protein (DUF455 family)
MTANLQPQNRPDIGPKDIGPKDIGPATLACFLAADAVQKADQVRQLASRLRAGEFTSLQPLIMPTRPGRPAAPALLPPGKVPRRRISTSPSGRIALLHAIAHIELNAIDLALDMAGRYGAEAMPFDFVRDWIAVADDEARHFLMLEDRLRELDSFYGALPAHDGLWQAVEATSADLPGRLAIAPLVLEARGLDITPQLITRLEAVGDSRTAACFKIIYEDEIGHVATGKRWFDFVCGLDRRDPVSSWQNLVRRYFRGQLKPPFNLEARKAARFSAAFYGPLAETG